jgi:DNA primase
VPPNQATIDAVREGSDLVELIRGRVSLVRRSGRWWGRCPFHDERTPSFSLLPPDFRRYYCHGCGATGDAIDWMREQEGAGSFYEAIEQLAERFGIPVEYSEEDATAQARREARRRREQLLERAAASATRPATAPCSPSGRSPRASPGTCCRARACRGAGGPPTSSCRA